MPKNEATPRRTISRSGRVRPRGVSGDLSLAPMLYEIDYGGRVSKFAYHASHIHAIHSEAVRKALKKHCR